MNNIHPYLYLFQQLLISYCRCVNIYILIYKYKNISTLDNL